MVTSGKTTPAIRIASIAIAIGLHALFFRCLFVPSPAPVELIRPHVTRVTFVPPPPPPVRPVIPSDPPPPAPVAPPPPMIQEEAPVAIPPPPARPEVQDPPPPAKEERPVEETPAEPPPDPPREETAEATTPDEPPEPVPDPPPPLPEEKPVETKPTPPPAAKEGNEQAPETAPPSPATADAPPPAPAERHDSPSDGVYDERPALRQAIRPIYPLSARRKGQEGSVTCLVHVTERGKAERVEVVRSSGHGSLDEAAVRAIRKARFTPARKNGERVASETRLTFLFRLEDVR